MPSPLSTPPLGEGTPRQRVLLSADRAAIPAVAQRLRTAVRHERPLAIADTVSEVVKVKHAMDEGIKARKGIEY